jgi:hypothetical protein
MGLDRDKRASDLRTVLEKQSPRLGVRRGADDPHSVKIHCHET